MPTNGEHPRGFQIATERFKPIETRYDWAINPYPAAFHFASLTSRVTMQATEDRYGDGW
jgi:hypothetical protein